MRVLIACEYSGRVREAFAALGHDAWSCDLLPADDGSPNHFQEDCIEVIQRERWDLIIMHPPCTALAVSGNAWYGQGMPKNDERIEAIEWTTHLWETAKANADGVCMENPVGVLPFKPTQYVQPWMFGHPESKKTGFWLHNLPPLTETNNVKAEMDKLPKNKQQRLHYLPPSADRWKIRSTTFQGIADAMADQWGSVTELFGFTVIDRDGGEMFSSEPEYETGKEAQIAGEHSLCDLNGGSLEVWLWDDSLEDITKTWEV